MPAIPGQSLRGGQSGLRVSHHSTGPPVQGSPGAAKFHEARSTGTQATMPRAHLLPDGQNSTSRRLPGAPEVNLETLLGKPVTVVLDD